jgi:hypothetical protein
MAMKHKTTAAAGLNEAQRRFLMGLGDDVETHYEGLDVMLWNELDHLSFRGDADEPYYAGDGIRLSARQLVERFGDEFLKKYAAEHGRNEKPSWWHRFRGGQDERP